MSVVEPQMVQVPAGRLTMGVPECPPKANFHWRWHTGRVVDVQAFIKGKYPVTNAEYRSYLQDTGGAAPSENDAEGFGADGQPMVGVSWEDATAYCRWLADRTGKPYRLPGDAEWEYAARGGSGDTIFPWGDALDPAHACFGGRAAPEPVGRYPANGFGLCDVVGGVWEWCEERYEEVSDGVPATQQPSGTEDPAQNRVLRGGSFRTQDLLQMYIAYRHEDPPDLRHESIGFRVAL